MFFEELFALSLVGNIVLLSPVVISKFRKCSYEDAVQLEKKALNAALKEFADYLKNETPVQINLLNNLDFYNQLCADWSKLSAINIDVLRRCEGYYNYADNGFHYLQFEYVGENLEYFLEAVKGNIRRQLQSLQYPEPLINAFFKPFENSKTHFICSFYFTINELEYATLLRYLNDKKEVLRKQALEDYEYSKNFVDEDLNAELAELEEND